MRITTTDTNASWGLAPANAPGRIEVLPAPPPDTEVAATLSGPAEQVLLALWKRLDLATADVTISGRATWSSASSPGRSAPDRSARRPRPSLDGLPNSGRLW
jgi:hypothetical protein